VIYFYRNKCVKGDGLRSKFYYFFATVDEAKRLKRKGKC